MGKRLDRLLGRSFKTSKFKPLASLALSRLVVLKNRAQIRLSQARSDVAQLLLLGHHERALLRVELVIKELDMLDAYAVIQNHCSLLIERVNLIEQEKVCPDELKEALSSLIYAASRLGGGEFPEIQEMRSLLSSRYGKDFAACAVELTSNCAVDPKLMEKLSTMQPSLESRKRVLKEIAAENGIALLLTEPSDVPEERMDMDEVLGQGRPSNLDIPPKAIDNDEVSGLFYAGVEYSDVAEAAQAAFLSAAYAAAAARAAVELSRCESSNTDDQNSPGTRRPDSNQRFDSQDIHFDDEMVADHDGGFTPDSSYPVQVSAEFRVGATIEPSAGDHALKRLESETMGVQRLNLERRPISVRNMRPGGY